MTITQLTYFVTVAETLNFRRAAEKLYLSQPALSIAISRLEEELKVSLFIRNGHTVELTKYGNFYYKRMKHILQDIQSATHEIHHLTDSYTGQVDLAYIPTLTRQFIPNLLQEIKGQEPLANFKFRLFDNFSGKILQGILDRTYDAGFCAKTMSHPHLTLVPAFPTEVVALVPADHPLADRENLELKELQREPFIAYQPYSAMYQPVMELLDRHELNMNVIMFAPEEDSITDLVARGFGVSLVSSSLYMNSQAVRQIPLQGRKYCRMVHFAYSNNTYYTDAVLLLIDYILHECIPRWQEETRQKIGDDYEIIL